MYILSKFYFVNRYCLSISTVLPLYTRLRVDYNMPGQMPAAEAPLTCRRVNCHLYAILTLVDAGTGQVQRQTGCATD